MINIKKKILIGSLGIVSVVATPLAVAVSCGSSVEKIETVDIFSALDNAKQNATKWNHNHNIVQTSEEFTEEEYNKIMPNIGSIVRQQQDTFKFTPTQYNFATFKSTNFYAIFNMNHDTKGLNLDDKILLFETKANLDDFIIFNNKTYFPFQDKNGARWSKEDIATILIQSGNTNALFQNTNEIKGISIGTKTNNNFFKFIGSQFDKLNKNYRSPMGYFIGDVLKQFMKSIGGTIPMMNVIVDKIENSNKKGNFCGIGSEIWNGITSTKYKNADGVFKAWTNEKNNGNISGVKFLFDFSTHPIKDYVKNIISKFAPIAKLPIGIKGLDLKNLLGQLEGKEISATIKLGELQKIIHTQKIGKINPGIISILGGFVNKEWADFMAPVFTIAKDEIVLPWSDTDNIITLIIKSIPGLGKFSSMIPKQLTPEFIQQLQPIEETLTKILNIFEEVDNNRLMKHNKFVFGEKLLSEINKQIPSSGKYIQLVSRIINAVKELYE